MKQLEHDQQVNLIKWWALQHKQYRLPEFALYANPNGGNRNIVTAVKLKREGTRRGVLDLTLLTPNRYFHGLFIEMKAGKNKASKEQNEFMGHALTVGYQCAVCYSFTEAIAVIDDYLKAR